MSLSFNLRLELLCFFSSVWKICTSRFYIKQENRYRQITNWRWNWSQFAGQGKRIINHIEKLSITRQILIKLPILLHMICISKFETIINIFCVYDKSALHSRKYRQAQSELHMTCVFWIRKTFCLLNRRNKNSCITAICFSI